jgi:hypothetical protein
MSERDYLDGLQGERKPTILNRILPTKGDLDLRRGYGDRLKNQALAAEIGRQIKANSQNKSNKPSESSGDSGGIGGDLGMSFFFGLPLLGIGSLISWAATSQGGKAIGALIFLGGIYVLRAIVLGIFAILIGLVVMLLIIQYACVGDTKKVVRTEPLTSIAAIKPKNMASDELYVKDNDVFKKLGFLEFRGINSNDGIPINHMKQAWVINAKSYLYAVNKLPTGFCWTKTTIYKSDIKNSLIVNTGGTWELTSAFDIVDEKIDEKSVIVFKIKKSMPIGYYLLHKNSGLFNDEYALLFNK